MNNDRDLTKPISVEKNIVTPTLSEAQPITENSEQIIQQLKARVDEIQREITLLEEQKEQARLAGVEERAKLMILWKQKLITSSEEFKVLSQKIGESEEFIYQQLQRKNTEYRLTRIKFLSTAVPPDPLRQRVLDLHVKENLSNFLSDNIQAGGSNAQGVFQIEHGDFVLIKKSKETYEWEAALPYLMQNIGVNRIPRVLEVFETDDATYKIMEKATGIQVDQLSEEQIAVIPQEHFNQFVRDIALLDRKGLQIDPSKKSNFFYDDQKGFIIIDIGDYHHLPNRKGTPGNVRIEHLRPIFTGPKQDQRIINKIQIAIA